MKIKRNLSVALIAVSSYLSLLALEPEVDYSSGFISIDNVERTPDGTRVGVTLKNHPHYWVKVDSTEVLNDAPTGQTFRLTGQENLPLSTEIFMPESGHHQGTVIFESIGTFASVPTFNNRNLHQYLYQFFQSPYYHNYCRSITKKSGQAFYNLSRQKLKQCPVSIPPILEIPRILEKLNCSLAELSK